MKYDIQHELSLRHLAFSICFIKFAFFFVVVYFFLKLEKVQKLRNRLGSLNSIAFVTIKVLLIYKAWRFIELPKEG